MKKQIYQAVESVKDELFYINKQMYLNPEIGYQEYESAKMLVDMLKKEGFEVEAPYAGMDTAFRAVYDSGKPGPTIAILAEYDALPGIGHGCGHNVIATGTLGAAVGFKRAVKDFTGKLVYLGAPAEEGAVDNAGGKVLMVDAGVFKDIDAAIMFHPTTVRHGLGGTSNARYAMEVVFKGKTSHAAGAPHLGINALDAAILSFNNWNALRQHVKPDVRIHGVITEGGEAPNIIPDRAVIRMYVRAEDADYLEEVVEKVRNCIRAGALATGATVEMRQTANTYKNMVTNSVLANLFADNLEALGEEVDREVRSGAGSTDMANVSQEVPGIHPYISISPERLNGHSTDLADATISKSGEHGIVVSAKTLASVAWDLFDNPKYLKEAKAEFAKWQESRK